MPSNQSGGGEIRKTPIEAGLVDCLVALPGQLFYSTQIRACRWFLARDRSSRPYNAAGSAPGGKFRDCRGQVRFIGAQSGARPSFPAWR